MKPLESQSGMVRSPRPVLLVHSGDNWLRGSERVVLDLLNSLNDQQFPPFVLCNTPAMYDAVKALNVQVERRDFPVSQRELRELITAYRIRLIHSACASPVRWLLSSARSLQLPLIAQLQTVYPRYLRYSEFLHQAAVVVGVSEAAIKGLREDGMPETSLRVIHNGIDPGRLELGDAQGLRGSLSIPADAIVCVFAGALTPEKSVSTLLEASCLVPSNTHFIVVGDGPERETLRDFALRLPSSGRIHFVGKQQHVGAIFRDVADICVLPSVHEGFPLVLVEAAYFNVPAVATDVGGIREAVGHEVSGLIVPPRNPDALARALRRLIENDQLRQAMGDAAKGRVEAQFLIRKMVSSFESLYEELLSAPRRRFAWTGSWRIEPYWNLALHTTRRLFSQLIKLVL